MFQSLVDRFWKWWTREPPDPTHWNDPVALETHWTPCNPGGAGQRTHRLVKVSAQRWEFRSTIADRVMSSLLLGLGSVVVAVAGGLSLMGYVSGSDIRIPMVLGLAFAATGLYLVLHPREPVIFDKDQGLFWKGKRSPAEVPADEELNDCATLESIHALQIVREMCRGRKGGWFYSYELNLVLGNGGRINILDYGGRRRIRKDAASLAAFLGVPVWDATDY